MDQSSSSEGDASTRFTAASEVSIVSGSSSREEKTSENHFQLTLAERSKRRSRDRHRRGKTGSRGEEYEGE
eukprot:3432227-Rhodomonas_salina.1